MPGHAACAVAGGLLTVAMLGACSPTYDWRTVTNDDSGYSVDLPAKPGGDERSVEVGGTPMRMHMQTAEAGDAVFVVGTVELPDAQAGTQQKALSFLRAGLARNVGVPAADVHEVSVPLASGGAIAGVEMEVTGDAGGRQQTRTIHARLVAKGMRAYQIAIVASKQPPTEDVDQFFQSFRLF